MQPTISLLLAYSVAIFFMSLAGGTAPLWIRLTHTRLQIAMSLIGGLMLGVGLLHLMPHSFVAMGSIDQTALWMVLGLLTMFSLIRIFHVHHHAPGEPAHENCQHGVPLSHSHDDHGHEHSHGHDHGHETSPSRLNWLGLMVGLSLHTLIDGVALASSVAVEADHAIPGLWGLGAFLAILLHKPLDAMSIATVMKAGGWSSRSVQAVNVLFALMCPLGALLFVNGVDLVAVDQQHVLGMALAFSAGVFLCISLSDLLPEVQFHSHDRTVLTASLVCGIVLAYLITFVEPEHVHGQGSSSSNQHEHHGHESGQENAGHGYSEGDEHDHQH